MGQSPMICLRKVALLLLLVPQILTAQDSRFGDELSKRNQARDRTYDVQHYLLDIVLDHGEKKVSGSVSVTLSPINDGLDRVILDSAELRIGRVELNGHALSYDLSGQKLAIQLDRPYKSNETITLKIGYEGHPRKGLYFVGPDSAYPARPRQIWSQGEEEDSHYWFPCYDFPNDRATSEMIVTVAKPFTVVGNGRLLGVRDGGTTRTFHWKMETPHASYLISLAAGEFEHYSDSFNNVPTDYYVPVGTGREKAFRSFGRTPDMMRFFSEKIGIPYPYSKYAQTAVAEFVAGGMENISATTQTDRTLHDEQAHEDFKSESLVAHELAHQWWGDLLTSNDWSQIWLNEGFATYFEALYTESWLGTDEFRHKLLEMAQSYMEEDRTKYRRPIVTNFYTDPLDLFDSHTYEKGALVLHMMRYMLGDDPFFKALHHYGKRFAERNVDTDDLRKASQEATGRNLERFFDQWIYHGGYPEYEVEWAWENTLARVSVRQKQKVDSVTPLFEMPVVIDFTLPAGQLKSFTVQVEKAEQTFFFPLEAKPMLVRFDPGNYILKTLDFKKDLSELLYQLAKDPDVIGRIRAAQALSKFPYDKAALAALKAALHGDPFFAVRAAAAASLGTIKGDSARDALLEATTDKDSRARREVVLALGEFQRDPKAISAIKNLLETDGSTVVQANAIRALKSSKSENVFEILKEALARDSHMDIVRRAALRALADLDQVEKVRPIIMEWTEAGRSENARTAAISLLPKVAGKNERQTVDFLIGLLRDPLIFVRSAAVSALGEMEDSQAIDALEGTATNEADAGLRKAARSAIAEIRKGESPKTTGAELGPEIERLKRDNQELKERVRKLEQRLAETKR